MPAGRNLHSCTGSHGIRRRTDHAPRGDPSPSFNVQVIGICRWCYPSATRDFRLIPDDLAAAREEPYAPHRKPHRLFLLDTILLPALRAQTDKDFTLVFLTGDTLPEPYRQEVLDLAADVPQIKRVFAAEGQPQQDLVRRLMIELRDPAAVAVAGFRLDAAAAVSVDFVEQTRRIFGGVRPLFGGAGQLALDYTRGFVMKTTRRGYEFLPITSRWWTPGPVIFIRPDIQQSVLDFHHMQLWHSMHLLMHTEWPMFLRGVHHSNDSSIEKFGKRSGPSKVDPGQIRSILHGRYGIDLQQVHRTWRRRGAAFFGAADIAETAADDAPTRPHEPAGRTE